MSQDYKAEERIIKDIIYRNVKPVDPEKKKKRLQLTIYYKSMKTSNLLIRNRPTQTRTALQQDNFRQRKRPTPTTVLRSHLHYKFRNVRQHTSTEFSSPSHPEMQNTEKPCAPDQPMRTHAYLLWTSRRFTS